MTGEVIAGIQENPSPRAIFALRFAELYEAAGNPTLRRVAAAAETRMRAAQGNRVGSGASAQRISDWKAGRNVPARFESLLPVVLTLMELARKSGRALPRNVAEPKEWQRIWHAATSWNPEDESETDCPYPGLTSYGAGNHRLFFGRTGATAELTALVRESHGPVAVIGASGVGKSSLLAAGLAPALADWRIAALTPGAHPIAALADALDLTPADGPRRLLIIDQFEELFTTCTGESEREDFLRILNDCTSRTDDPVAVVVALRADFYAHCLNYRILQHALEQRSYLLGPMQPDELAQAISGPARTVGLTLEPGLEELVITELCGVGDQHDRRDYHPGALPLLSHVMAATWQHREGRKLTVAGYRKAGGVVGSVAETAEHAWNELTETQQAAAKDILLGLVTVSQDARDTRRTAPRTELLRRATDPEDATAALELLSRTRLITLDAESVTLTHEIVLTAWPRLRAWIDEDRVGYLVRQRVELDAAEWAAQERDSALLYRGTRLQNAMEHVDPPPVGSLADEFLTAATTARDHTRRRSSRRKAILAVLGVALLLLGFAVYAQTRLASRQLDDKNFNAVLSTADRLLTVDPSLAAQLELVAWQLRPGDAEVRTRLLRAQALPLVTSTPAHRTGIAQVAYRPDGRVLGSIDYEGTLRLWDTADAQHPQPLGAPIDDANRVAFRGDGRAMTTIGANGDIKLWDVSNPAAPHQLSILPVPTGRVTAANPVRTEFSGDGHTLVTVSQTDMTLWDVHDPATPIRGTTQTLDRTSPGTTRSISRLSFAPDGRTMAIGYDDIAHNARIQLWNITAATAPATVITEFASGIDGFVDFAFSSDGMLAVGGGNIAARTIDPSVARAQLWDLTDPAQPHPAGPPLKLPSGGLSSLTFAPNTRVLAAAADTGVSLWNLTEPDFPTLISDQLSMSAGICRFSSVQVPCLGGPNTLGFTPDGRTLATGGTDGSLHTWSLPPARLGGQAGWVARPAFDATGDRMVTQSNDGRLAVWDLRDRQRPRRIGEYRSGQDYYSADLSPDGRTLLLTTMISMTTKVLDLSDPGNIRPIADWPFRSTSSGDAIVSPDWRTLAVVTSSDIQLWDISDRTRPRRFAGQIPGTLNSPSASFGPDGRTLLVDTRELGKTNDFVVTRWDVGNPDQPKPLGEILRTPYLPAEYAAFTPDQRTMVVVTPDNLRSWDISNPAGAVALGKPFAAGTLPVGVLGFTADARTLLISSSDGAVQLWNFRDPGYPEKIGGPLTEPSRTRWNAVPHPDGRFVAGGNNEGGIMLWDLDEQHAVDRICTVTGKSWTSELWQRYLPQLPYSPPCD